MCILYYVLIGRLQENVGCLVEGAIDLDFRKPVIDEEARRITQYDINNYGNNWRINRRVFYTDEELEETIEELLKVKLP